MLGFRTLDVWDLGLEHLRPTKGHISCIVCPTKEYARTFVQGSCRDS